MMLSFIRWGLVVLRVLIIQDYRGQTPRITTHRQCLMWVTTIKVTSMVEFTTTKGSQELSELEGDIPLIISKS